MGGNPRKVFALNVSSEGTFYALGICFLSCQMGRVQGPRRSKPVGLPTANWIEWVTGVATDCAVYLKSATDFELELAT